MTPLPNDSGSVPSGESGEPGIAPGSAVPGHPAFALRLVSARPNAVALLGRSTTSGMIGTPAGAIRLDLESGALCSSTSTFATLTTDAPGTETVTVSLPSGATLPGTSFFAH